MLAARPEAQPRPVHRTPVPAPIPAVRPVPVHPAAHAAPAPGALNAAQQRLVAELDALEKQAKALGEANRHALSTRRFTELLTEWLPARCAEVRQMVGVPGGHVRRDHVAALQWLSMVHAEVEEQLRQRKDPQLLPLLGDADALAEACYRPIVQFARTMQLPLAAAHPVTRLSEVDLSIWTGFAPTSIAPIFLPQDFFSRVAWWPAVAHEIGHSFLISVNGLRDRIGAELQLPSEAEGSLPLELNELGQLEPSELWRVHGVWFEELFCDVFGTLMCGPAYGLTMVEHFSFKEDPREVLAVMPAGNTGRYGVHPPRHLRVHVVAWVLEHAGFHREAKGLLDSWYTRNQLDRIAGGGSAVEGERASPPLLFYTRHGYVYVPWAAVEGSTRHIVERLYRGPIVSLRGHGLQAISGLDYGPALHAQAQRAKNALLAGQVPKERDPRAIISGAVLAWIDRPSMEVQILQRARAAIPAVGTFERAPDAFHQEKDGFAAAPSTVTGPLELSAEAVRQALLLREMLARPAPRRAPR